MQRRQVNVILKYVIPHTHSITLLRMTCTSPTWRAYLVPIIQTRIDEQELVVHYATQTSCCINDVTFQVTFDEHLIHKKAHGWRPMRNRRNEEDWICFVVCLALHKEPYCSMCDSFTDRLREAGVLQQLYFTTGHNWLFDQFCVAIGGDKMNFFEALFIAQGQRPAKNSNDH